MTLTRIEQKRIYSSHAWKKTRSETMERDQWTCQLHYPGCTTAATEVDHIIQLTKGGAPYDLRNTRAVCHHCHTQRTNAYSPSRVW